MAKLGSTRSPTGHRTLAQSRAHDARYKRKASVKEKDREQHRLRYKMEKEGKVSKGDGKQIDHKKPRSKGGTDARSNLRIVSKSKNSAHGLGRNGTRPGAGKR